MVVFLGRYFVLGIGLSFAGTATAVVSYFETHTVPLAALGIAILILGLTAVSLPDQVSASEAMKALLQGSTLGIDPILDLASERMAETDSAKPLGAKPASGHDWKEFISDAEGHEKTVYNASERGRNSGGIKSIYLPPDLGYSKGRQSDRYEGKASVYIPLAVRAAPTSFEEMSRAPVNILPEDKAQIGVRVFTAGAFLGQVAEIKGEDANLDDALQYVLVEFAELCSQVRATEIEDTVVVEIDDVKISPESTNYRNLLGSLPTSLAASVVSIVREAPVVITDEEIAPTKTVARLSTLRLKKEDEERILV